MSTIVELKVRREGLVGGTQYGEICHTSTGAPYTKSTEVSMMMIHPSMASITVLYKMREEHKHGTNLVIIAIMNLDKIVIFICINNGMIFCVLDGYIYLLLSMAINPKV